ncbi:MAG: FAD-dependent oxidoreductase [Patescibacteria group bacterium]
MKKVEFLILGAGVSGIFCAKNLLNKRKKNLLVLEKENRAGGLCRSFKLGNLYYDIGAHALHKKTLDKHDFAENINSQSVYCQTRKAKIYFMGKFIPHPFQLHLFYTPLKVKLKCFFDFLLKKKVPGENFKSWLYSNFGKSICDLFLIPYNEKIWRIDLARLSLNWISRVPVGMVKLLIGLLFPGKKNYSTNEYVCYPKVGGFENLFKKPIEDIQNYIIFDSEVVKLDLANKTAETKKGEQFSYEKIISTLPVDILIKKIINNPDRETLDLAEKLDKVSTCLATFLSAKSNTDLQRVYVPNNNYFSHRVIINSNSSDFLKQQQESLFSLEISYKDKTELPGENEIKENCINLLKDLGFIKEKADIKESRIEYFEYMYPAQTIGLEDAVVKIRKYLERFDCYTMGRFGSWSYSNIDGIFKESKEIFDRLV